MSTRKRFGMSWWNVVMAAVTLIAGVIMAVLGRWVAAGIFLVVALAIAGSAVYARSGRASDLTRLNAAEYVDERDRAVGTRALAIVGVVALLLTMTVFVIGMVLLEPGSPMFVVLTGQVLALAVAWAIANVVALRRS
ncbi:hypothetical protein SAMN04487783_1708 [Agrococcus baldri]|uniref:Uncharacterized protein n=1 Tax=Agrococcus baldri TaxID=153730 RepID=A0AA94KZR8_9MICO|nr:hypothetical protein [Agrococcus baldri]SFS13823.1 hypothetical protein SAMN04487783_1708 [Agrococcus baldri]